LKKNRKKQATLIPGANSSRCPQCGNPVVLRSADGVYKDNPNGTMVYACAKYPECDTYVRVFPGTKKAVGTLAGGKLRQLRQEAHRHFDRLHLSGIMSRKEAYEWLAVMLQAPLSQTHIGYLGEYYCQQVIEESSKLFENHRRAQGGGRAYPLCQAAGGEFCGTE
jgi:ssDNA-binding Zn-finger/Zn-ribbon topoisomerase 1